MNPNGSVSVCAVFLRDYKSQGARGNLVSPSTPGPASLQPESRRLTCSRPLPRPVLRSLQPEPEPEPEEAPGARICPGSVSSTRPGVQRLWRSPRPAFLGVLGGTWTPGPRAALGLRRRQGPWKERSRILDLLSRRKEGLDA